MGIYISKVGKMVKFVFDLDGTICFRGQPLSVDITAVLEDCLQKGHEVIFASARPIRDLLPVLPESLRRLSMVGGNGAFIAVNGEIQESAAFEETTVEAMKEIIAAYQLPYLVDGHWDYAFTGSETHPIYQNLDPLKLAKKVALQDLKAIVKIVLFPGTQHQHILAQLQQLNISLFEHTAENIVDISPNGIDKWTGLKKLGVEQNQFIAFGNDANDASMFKHALKSVCVGEHEVSKLATLQVPSKEAAVINIIKQLIECQAPEQF
ncbi:HAD-IIB family hydrolase [Lysinibacillus sp. NPDC097195]|uniref:HAD-IIB family hydrolase n=1 Tax=Lysinibacillus sp. NPDC097195 TaxID=3364141 RepID=UPI00382100E7